MADWEVAAEADFQQRKDQAKLAQERAEALAEKQRAEDLAEQEARRAARIRQKARDEERYWEEVKQKNQLCLTKKRAPLTLLDVQKTTNQHAGKRGAFKSARQRAAEARSVKARLQRQKAEQMMEQHKEDERNRKLKEELENGMSVQERQTFLMLEKMEGAAAEAMKARKKAMEDRILRDAEEAEAKEKAKEIAKEMERKAKEEKTKHYEELASKSKMQKSGCRYWGDVIRDHKTMEEGGAKHGYGEFFWKDGRRVYEGEYFRGRMQGKGLIELSNGDTWEGTFVDDEMQGLGKYTFVGDGKLDPALREQRWCFYHRSRRVCWHDEVQPGMRIRFLEQRMGLRTERVGSVIRAASTDTSTKSFRRGTFLIKFDLDQATWKNLDQEQDWELLNTAARCTLNPAICGEIENDTLAGRAKYSTSNTFGNPNVDDSISYATDRPHFEHAPLVREYYM